MSNIKILHPEVPYDEEFSAVWPYRETFFGEKINNSAKRPTISHSNFRRSEPWLLTGLRQPHPAGRRELALPPSGRSPGAGRARRARPRPGHSRLIRGGPGP